MKTLLIMTDNLFGVSRRIGRTVALIDENLFGLKFWHNDGPHKPEIMNSKSPDSVFWKIKWHYIFTQLEIL